MAILTSNIWIDFLLVFAIFAKTVWFYYYFALYSLPKKEYNKNYTGKVALIMPVYNEQKDRLRNAIQSAQRAEGINEIIIVNDGGKPINLADYDGEVKAQSIQLVNLYKNMGKRRAQYEGIQRAEKDTDTFVFMDSDTILQKDSIIKLTKPMQDRHIGAATGCILVKNRKDNILTKCLSAMYWSASNIWREAPSRMGFVQVTNGQLSCYRASIIRKIMPDYLSQKFMGVECTLSDDRYLTHHIQTDFNKQVVYVSEAVVHTYVPNTFKKIYLMFLRWKRGSWRETILLTQNSHRKPILIIDVWANHLIQVMQTVVRIGVILAAILVTPWVLVYYLLVIMIVSLLFGFHMIVTNIREIGYRVLYSVLNEMVFAWSHIHALLTIHKQNTWSTR